MPFAVPGHSQGSGAYFADGVLFTGDALRITSKQKIIVPSVIFYTERAQASLKRLGQDVKFIDSAHTRTVVGLGPLLEFGGS